VKRLQTGLTCAANWVSNCSRERRDGQINTSHARCGQILVECATLDHQIDSLVYELYDLTDDEIKIVEGEK
jgi:hypothetical protein